VQEYSTALELLRCWKLFSFYFSRSIPLNCIYLYATYIRTKTTTGVYNRCQIYSFAVTKTKQPVIRAVESEVPSSDSWQFRLSDSDSGPTPTFSCISYL